MLDNKQQKEIKDTKMTFNAPSFEKLNFYLDSENWDLVVKNHIMESYKWNKPIEPMLAKSIFKFEDSDFEKACQIRMDIDHQVKTRKRDEKRGVKNYTVVERGDNWFIAH